MARGWAIERRAQHQARYPIEDKARRNAEAQARYRKRHGAERMRVRQVANLLMKQSGFEVGDLATAIRAAVGDAVAREIGAMLVASRRRRRRDP